MILQIKHTEELAKKGIETLGQIDDPNTRFTYIVLVIIIILMSYGIIWLFRLKIKEVDKKDDELKKKDEEMRKQGDKIYSMMEQNLSMTSRLDSMIDKMTQAYMLIEASQKKLNEEIITRLQTMQTNCEIHAQRN